MIFFCLPFDPAKHNLSANFLVPPLLLPLPLLEYQIFAIQNVIYRHIFMQKIQWYPRVSSSTQSPIICRRVSPSVECIFWVYHGHINNTRLVGWHHHEGDWVTTLLTCCCCFCYLCKIRETKSKKKWRNSHHKYFARFNWHAFRWCKHFRLV